MKHFQNDVHFALRDVAPGIWWLLMATSHPPSGSGRSAVDLEQHGERVSI